MFGSVVVGFAKLVGFLVVCTSAIVTFYAAVHTINVNSQLDVFLAGLLALLLGLVAGPLYCLISFFGLHHYLAFSPLGALLLVIPVFLAWCVLAYTTVAGVLRG